MAVASCLASPCAAMPPWVRSAHFFPNALEGTSQRREVDANAVEKDAADIEVGHLKISFRRSQDDLSKYPKNKAMSKAMRPWAT